jgi:hypothetical protein
MWLLHVTGNNTALWRHVSALVTARYLLSYDSAGLSHIPKPF